MPGGESGGEGGTRIADPLGLFPPRSRRALRLEIGFGGGEHLAAQAEAHPDTAFIGCEPFVNGVAKLLSRIEARGLANIRIHMDDARHLVAALPEASVERVDILFPDPWPKTRHHKRRLVSTAFLDALARVMADGGRLALATDHRGSARWMLARLVPHPASACRRTTGRCRRTTG